MRILAIETSCDDTGIAILEAKGLKRPGFRILSNIVSSQIKIHKKWGGVYPTLAKREHQKNLVPVLSRALKRAKFSKQEAQLLKRVKFPERRKELSFLRKTKELEKILERDPRLSKRLLIFFKEYQKPKIDCIAVTIGPGLEPCLWVGVNFARALAYFWNLPIVPVNHIEAHILAIFLGKEVKGLRLENRNYPFPAICLIVSGGHTQLILIKNLGKYEILGETRDDAAGECFDKTARILGLDYPGGPAIETEATKYRVSDVKLQIKLPRPMIFSKDYDFSFSGLKTAVLYDFKKRKQKTKKSKQYIREMAAEIQQAIIDVLIKKTMKAAKDFRIKTIILGGGVVANKELRRQIIKRIKKEIPDTKCYIPPTKYCTDNAAMIAVNGYFNYKKGEKKSWPDISVNANLKITQS